MFGVNPHSLCAAEEFQEALAADPDADESFTICSVSCLRFSKIEGLTVDVIKAEQAELLKKNKENLKKEA